MMGVQAIQVSLVCIAAAAAGCAPPVLVASVGLKAVATGSAVYTDGKLEAVTVIPMEDVFEATQAVLIELQFTLNYTRLRADSAYIEARELSGRRIKIWLDRKTPVVTKASLRVGLLGDQALSRLIFARVVEHLGVGPAINPEAPFFQPELLPTTPLEKPAPGESGAGDSTGADQQSAAANTIPVLGPERALTPAPPRP